MWLGFRVFGLGWYVAGCIIIGTVGGLKLDDVLGSEPWLTILGTLIGTVAAFYGIYKLVLPLMKELNKGNGMTDGGKT